VGLVEAMKLFTAVEAGVAGTVVEVLVANGDYVEFEQPLMRIQTSQQGA
jgi:biotin carboxyl carrier protein